VGHLQYGWWFAHWRNFDRRERAAIALAGAACDLDGLSMFWGSDTYYKYHHMLFHNVGSVLAVILLGGLLFWRRPWVWLLVVFAFGAHIVEDYFSIPWDMKPWAPFNSTVVNLNHHLSTQFVQYGLQTVAMVFILGITVRIYIKHKRTPLEIISPAFDRLIMNYALLPWKNHCASCSHRAHFRCDQCGKTFCANHAKPVRGCAVACNNCAGSTGASPLSPAV
jgi:LexA-binding, inner membrane-associated putative hydrolase